MDLGAGRETGGRSSALELFLDRAQQANPSFAPGDDDLDQVGRICGLVQGIPLGIELAAPWVTVLSCGEIADEVDRSLDFLEETGGESGHRHHSLRAVFDSSWNLLSNPQRTAFCRLSVFPAPFSRDAAETIAATSVRTLMELRSRSLLRQTGDGNLQLHPLLRQFASEMVPPAEARELASLHGRFYVDRLLVREPDLRGGSRQLDVVAELADEHENLRLAVEWAVANLSADQVVGVLGAVHQFYLNYGWHEGREAFARLFGLIEDPAGNDRGSVPSRLPWLWAGAYLSVYEAALAQVELGEALLDRVLPEWEKLGGIGLATCRYSQGVLASERGDYPAAREHLAAALEGARHAGEGVLIGTTLLWFGWVITELGDPEAGKRLFEECLAVMSVPTNHWGKAFALSKLGVAADGMGEHDRAAQFHQESREMFVKTNDLAGQAYTLSRLSATYWLMGDYERSRASGLEGLALFEQVNHRWGVSASLCRIGFAELRLGHTESAAGRFLAALDGAEQSGLLALSLYALVGVGTLLAERGEDGRSTEMLSFVGAHPAMPPQYRVFTDPPLAGLRRRLEAESFDAAAERGRRAELAEMIGRARTALSRTSV